MEESLWDLMTQGGPKLAVAATIWIVLGLSVINLAVAIERLIAQWKFVTRARLLGEQVTRCLARGAIEEGRSACERSPSPLADVFLVGYERLGRAKPEHVVTAVHRERMRVNQDLKAHLWMLGTIGATAPFVGLFGTVLGIMGAMTGIKPNEVSFDKVAGPISGALIVTAFGIIVAVMAVILFNFFSQRGNRIATEMKLITDEFLELLLEVPSDSQPNRKAKHDGEDRDHDERAERPKRVKGDKDGDGDREAA